MSAIGRAGAGWIRLGIVILLVSVVPGCGTESPAPPARDLLLITIDTARADRFSYVAGEGPGTPRIDELADEGVGFVNAISPVPLTLPAHATLFTGRQPPTHTVRDNGAFRLPAAETTLAEVLEGAGFRTAAFVGARVLEARYGLDQGFGFYEDRIAERGDPSVLYYAERPGEDVVELAGRWIDALDRSEGRVFAWVHLFDPHAPYRPPEPERSRHAAGYDAEIAYTDRVIGDLLDRWEERRGLDRTLVVVTSDHGEALGEHGEATHGVLVHDATLRVPLVIRAPGVRLPRSVDDPVHLLDVLPTVASLLGLETPAGVQGRDLTPLLHGQSLPWLPVAGYAESLYASLHHGGAPLVALRGPRWKLVRGLGEELYDLESDPGELRDLAREANGREAEIATRMSDELDGVIDSLGGGTAEATTLDEDARAALQSLGYAGFGASSPGDAGGLRDPRAALMTLSRMADADRLALAGDADGAVRLYRAVLEDEPASLDARVRLATVLSGAARSDEAAAVLAEAVEIEPGEAWLHRRLGYTLEKSGRYRESLAAYDLGLRLHPDERDLRDGRWRCLNRLGKLEQLLVEAEAAVGADPSDGMARFTRAVACCGADDAGFRAALERELAELPGDPYLQTALARLRGTVPGS